LNPLVVMLLGGGGTVVLGGGTVVLGGGAVVVVFWLGVQMLGGRVKVRLAA